MPSFLSSIAGKAQNAIQASPLAGHLPAGLGPRPSSPDSSSQPPANQAASQSGHKSHTFEAITHQFRSLQQQYSTTSPVQKIITASKGVALDVDCLGRDAKAQSKELYTWGQSEPVDLKDVTDRLGYLNFVHGSLASSLALKLDASRVPLKLLRDAETALQPREAARATLEKQLARVENDPKKGGDLREQLKETDIEDARVKKEIELLKRKAIRESEKLKWEAIREYAEKLVLLSQASIPIVDALPTLPPSEAAPYSGAHATAAARAALQRALDNYKTGNVNLNAHQVGADLSRSDTRSFGETHATELSNITPYTPDHHANTPPIPQGPTPTFPAPHVAQSPKTPSPPIDISTLNQAPAPLPAALSPSAPVVTDNSNPLSEGVAVPVITPTVAETGMPLGGHPGPAKGSLHDLKPTGSQSSYSEGTGLTPPMPVPSPAPAAFESAEEEKRRLAASYSQQYASATPAGTSVKTEQPKHESAEEEKKRLEREERERILHGQPLRKNTEDDEDLPPYQEPTL
ncbi:hypothetical protein FA15DRAFT_662467 [Coprinopsis marcescibilis]|uniref:Sphingolipid long chain base-responsive protein LSP1 n=1 Tax=Coprinopsis marcescibilis TaxID=230819 RepID=A0A5C3LP48_COPMA|nr:hypothetical protein FA15DRAFT_662467 [Coprinopsis marcescibilis]